VDGHESDRAFAPALAAALGVEVPASPGQSSASGDLSLLAIGPNRFLIVDAAGQGGLADALRQTLSDRHHAILDVSHGRAVFRVGGDIRRDLLSKLCQIDLHPRAFALGSVAATLCAGVAGVIHHAAPDAFDLYVPRSFARHVREEILHRGEEYGVVLATYSGSV
jgi:sarcosine oxidase subunit gamma